MLEKLGAWAILKCKNFLYAAGFLAQVLASCLSFFRRGQVGYKILTRQILYTGVEALKVSAILALGIGAVIIIIGSSLLPQFGQSQLMYSILVIVIVRELGPLLTAFIIIARSGTAIATEIGTMVVSHEIEAYVASGINPIAYLVTPRFLGVTVSMVALSVYFSVFGLMGSWLVAQFLATVPFREYFSSLLASMKPADIFLSLFKTLIFGMIISLVSCYQGFKVERSSTEVPQAGIQAVSQCFVYCILAGAVLTVLSYF
jgi:phospholipid/cholesterol/gamma-HCH transport system permease protein